MRVGKCWQSRVEEITFITECNQSIRPTPFHVIAIKTFCVIVICKNLTRSQLYFAPKTLKSSNKCTNKNYAWCSQQDNNNKSLLNCCTSRRSRQYGWIIIVLEGLLNTIQSLTNTKKMISQMVLLYYRGLFAKLQSCLKDYKIESPCERLGTSYQMGKIIVHPFDRQCAV